MKICPKCKKIYDDSEVTCSDCRKKLKNIENKNTPVGVCKVSGVDRMRVHAALEDAGIPSGEQKVKASAEAITGDDLSGVIITVPYQAYDKALDICIGIGVVDDDTIDEKTKADIESKKEQYDKDIEEFEEMTPKKRTLVRIVSALLLILIFCLFIWGADWLIDFIKTLFYQ